MGRNIRGEYPADWKDIAKAVKDAAGWRCVRCGHRHESPKERLDCDDKCDLSRHPEWEKLLLPPATDGARELVVDAHGTWELDERGRRQRVLTVAHLDDDKSNCEWWNLAALCQVCHLSTQSRIDMDRPWLFEHSEWFKPYVAGFYAHRYLDRHLFRNAVEFALDELLALAPSAAPADVYAARVKLEEWDEDPPPHEAFRRALKALDMAGTGVYPVPLGMAMAAATLAALKLPVVDLAAGLLAVITTAAKYLPPEDLERLQAMNDPVLLYMNEEARAEAEPTYDGYCDWCAATARQPLPAVEYGQRVEAIKSEAHNR